MQKNMSGSLNGVIDEMLSGSVAGNIQFESSGGGSTVTITPTLESGTKIADFTIDDTSGSLYAPTPEPPIEYTAGANINISEENVISATDTTYTAGDNITIEDGVISATGSGSNYSTNEQVIGTWIDGKPLYEKSFIVNSPIANSTTIIQDATFSNIKNVIKMQGAYQRETSGYILYDPINSYENANYNSFCRIVKSSPNASEVGLAYFIKIPSGNTITNLFMTIQYTKTTD